MLRLRLEGVLRLRCVVGLHLYIVRDRCWPFDDMELDMRNRTERENQVVVVSVTQEASSAAFLVRGLYDTSDKLCLLFMERAMVSALSLYSSIGLAHKDVRRDVVVPGHESDRKKTSFTN